MRMWMTDPRGMCRQHLLGEHLEIHMFVNHINAGKGIDGYLDGNLLEIASLLHRHDALVHEMKTRGYQHNSPLPPVRTRGIPVDKVFRRIDREAALTELLRRCERCRGAKGLNGYL